MRERRRPEGDTEVKPEHEMEGFGIPCPPRHGADARKLFVPFGTSEVDPIASAASVMEAPSSAEEAVRDVQLAPPPAQNDGSV